MPPVFAGARTAHPVAKVPGGVSMDRAWSQPKRNSEKPRFRCLAAFGAWHMVPGCLGLARRLPGGWSAASVGWRCGDGSADSAGLTAGAGELFGGTNLAEQRARLGCGYWGTSVCKRAQLLPCRLYPPDHWGGVVVGPEWGRCLRIRCTRWSSRRSRLPCPHCMALGLGPTLSRPGVGPGRQTGPGLGPRRLVLRPIKDETALPTLGGAATIARACTALSGSESP
jgi:hypothetical protein